MKKFSFLFMYCFLATFLFAQTFSTSADVYMGLKKLNVLGSVLYIAAHPDDENTRLLTYFSKDKLYRTGYLSLTRGDGGQNLIGDEQGVELGLIRTQELLAARKIDGAEQFFTRAFDFGYSKTPEETFTKWDKEKILSDAVWVIRKFQPDVIITRFPTTGEGGHGHHTASGILANEAFAAAADPKRFPEQLKYVQPWQAKRILWNTFNFGNTNTTSFSQFHFDVGGYNQVLGKSYGEIAADSRSQHKSQGFGVPRSRGEAFEFFKTTGGTAPTKNLFDGVNTNWQRVKGGQKIAHLINATLASFNFLQPQKSVPRLVQVYKTLKEFPSGYWRDQKLKETKQLIEAASGLWIDVYTTEPYVAQTDSVRVNISLNNRLGINMHLKTFQLESFDSSFNSVLEKNTNFNFNKLFYVPQSRPVTQPYWLENKMEEGYYNVNNQQLIGLPDGQAAFIVSLKLNIEGQDLIIDKPVKYKFTDPVKGELYEPFYVIPPVSITADPQNLIAVNEKVTTVKFHADNYKNLSGIFRTVDSGNHYYLYPDLPTALTKGRRMDLSFADSLEKNQTKTATIQFEANGYHPFTNGFKLIRYNHLPTILFPTKSTYTIRPVDLKIYNKKIGYIVGAGDKVPEGLEQMGYEVTLLTDKEIARNNLQQFDAIITGVRAYNTNEWLNNQYDNLMSYVKNGGNLIIQYNTSTNIGPVRARIGPYNFNISRNRITDENAAVIFLLPSHPVLNFPNKITQTDFTGWVQERSIYHADKLDSNYKTILRMNDPGEQPDDGALVITKYGKGYFTYTGLVFFRELPAGVPGAYRLLANIIALNRKNEF